MSYALPHADPMLVKMHALTTPHPTAEHMRVRAEFWARWADAEGATAATGQVRANVEGMLREAERLERPVPVVQLAEVAAKRKPAKVAKPATVGAEQFWTLHGQAVRTMVARHGLRWRLTAPEHTIEVTLPSRLCSYVGPLGGRIKWRRDHCMPAPEYWPGGCLPAGVEALPLAPRYDGGMGDDHPTAIMLRLARAEQIVTDRRINRERAERVRFDREADGWADPSYPSMETLS